MPVSLSLPLRKQAYSGAPVVAVFDNLLPDNDDLRRKIAARARAEGTDAYSLLSAIGRDCVGALQFLPPDMEPGPAGVVDGEPINNKEIAAIIGNLAVTPLGHHRRCKLQNFDCRGARKDRAPLSRWKVVQASRDDSHDSHLQALNRQTVRTESISLIVRRMSIFV